MASANNTDNEAFLRSAAEDAATVQRILDGDKRAFHILEKKYRRIVLSLVRKMIRNDDDVADLVQDTFIKAYTGLPSYQSEYAFSSWLYRIASNGCIDFLRKRRLQTISIDRPISTDDGEMQMELPDTSYLADTHIYASERKKVLAEALANLPEPTLLARVRLLPERRVTAPLDVVPTPKVAPKVPRADTFPMVSALVSR